MTITLQWHDEDNRILYIDVVNAWSWAEVAQAEIDAEALINGADGPVSIIIDVLGIRTMAMDSAKRTLREVLETEQPNTEYIVFAVTNPVLQRVIRGAARLTQSSADRISMTDSVEDAAALIEARRTADT